jgi:hypothetical protein
MNEVTPPTRTQAAYIRKHIETMPFHTMRNNLQVNPHTMYMWVKMVYKPEQFRVYTDEGPQLHNHYLVSLNGFNYIVSFSVGVEHETIQYCEHQVGFDYEVSKLGYWEFNHLRHNVPTVLIKTDANYVSNFWATTKLWHE